MRLLCFPFEKGFCLGFFLPAFRSRMICLRGLLLLGHKNTLSHKASVSELEFANDFEMECKTIC